MNIEKTKEQETLKYLSAMEIIDFNKLGFVYGTETITDTLVLLKNKDIEIRKLKKDNKKKDYAYEDLQTAICEVCGTEDCPQDCNVCLKKYKSELEEKDKEISKLRLALPEIPQNNHGKQISYIDFVKENIKKDKIIDLMAEMLSTRYCFAHIPEKCNQSASDFDKSKCIPCIIEYFTKKVEGK